MKKLSSLIIISVLLFSFSKTNIINADFIEDILETKKITQEINLDKYSLKKININNKKIQDKFLKLDVINNKIKEALIIKYSKGDYWYYQMQGIVKNYNNFIYYANSYFSSVKNEELYWKSSETNLNIKNSFSEMVSSYIKFKEIVTKKDMN